MASLTPQALFTDAATKGTTALAFLIDQYTTDCLEWDPATLLMQVEDDFGVTPLRTVMDRANAASALLVTNLFHVSVETFTAVCAALGQGGAVASEFVPAGLEDVVWGVTEAALLQGSAYKEQEFSADIKLYVGFLLEQEGLYEPPGALRFATYPSPDASRATDMFLDDELAYQQYWRDQQEKKRDLELVVTQGLVTLFEQLEALPLADKDTSFVAGVLQGLRGA